MSETSSLLAGFILMCLFSVPAIAMFLVRAHGLRRAQRDADEKHQPDRGQSSTPAGPDPRG